MNKRFLALLEVTVALPDVLAYKMCHSPRHYAPSHDENFNFVPDVQMTGAALQYLMFGHRICFMELCSGRLFVGVGMHAISSVDTNEWRSLFPCGFEEPWKLGELKNQERMRALVAQ